MEKGCPKGKSGVKYMIPGAKVKNHDVLAHEWFLNFMPRPKYEHKRGAQAPRYANIGQGAMCQWHMSSTDRSGAETWEYEVRNNPYGIIYKNIKLKQSRFYHEK